MIDSTEHVARRVKRCGDLCGKEDAIVSEANVLQEYNAEQGQGEESRHEQAKQQGPSLDSGIDMPPSSGIYGKQSTQSYQTGFGEYKSDGVGWRKEHK